MSRVRRPSGSVPAIAFLCLFGTLSPGSGAAAEPAEEIIVTGHRVESGGAFGTKTDLPLIETPMSISVIDAERLDLLGVQSLNQALRYTAGVTPETRGGTVTRYDQFVLRGFSQINNYLDGMSLLYPGWYAFAQVDASTVERVEVIKGPASVLYGNAPPGGLVNFVSKTPPLKPQGEVELRVGTNDLVEGSADIGGPLDAGGRYAYRIVALGRQGDGQAETTSFERFLVAPSFTWRPDADTAVTLLGRYQSDPEASSYGGVPARGSALPNPLGRLPADFYDGEPGFEEYDRAQASIGWLADRRLWQGWMLRQNFRYLEVESDYAQVYARALLPDNRTLTRASIYSDEWANALTVDTQLSGEFATGPLAHTLLVGLDWQQQRADVVGGYGTAPDLDIFDPVYGQKVARPTVQLDQRITQEQTGIYIQDQVKLDGWVLMAGGRYDWYDKETFNRNTGTATIIDQGQFSGRVGLLHLFDNGLAPYLAFSQSFEPQSGQDFMGRPFDPATSDQWEAGVKYQSASDRTLVTLSVFDLTKQNVTTADPDHPGFSVQTGEVTAKGIELEGRIQVTDTLEAQFAYTYLDIKYTKDNGALKGRSPTGAADNVASLWLFNRFDTGVLDGLGLGVGVRHVGESAGDAANTFDAPDYTLVDAAATYDLAQAGLEGWGVNLAVANLFDNRHVSSCYSAAWCWYGAERSVQLGLKRTW